MKIGDKLVCKKDYNMSDSFMTTNFTKGHIYEIVTIKKSPICDDNVFLLNNIKLSFYVDKGLSFNRNGVCWYEYFTPLKEQRRKKLDNINENWR